MIAASSITFSAIRSHRNDLHLFESERDSLADTDAHGGERELATVAPQFFSRGKCEARARHAEGMAERDRAAVGIYLLVVVAGTKLAQYRQALRSECLVELDHVEVADLEAEALHQFLGCRGRADAHDARGHSGYGCAEDSRLRREPVALHRSFGCNDDSGRAVVNTRCVARRNGTVSADDRLELGQCLDGRCARVLVAVDQDRVALPLRDLDSNDFRPETAVGLGLGGLFLTLRAKASWSARLIWNSSATFSPVLGIVSSP